MATIQVQGIYKKDGNGIFQPLRDNYVKDANGIFQQFNPGSGIKGADGNWYVLKPAVIQLVGLLWDAENTADYASIDEAKLLAAATGGRLPTVDEWDRLRSVPYQYDVIAKGTWFAATSADLATKDKTKCLFLPLLGRDYLTSGIIGLGINSYHWNAKEIPNGYGNAFYVYNGTLGTENLPTGTKASVRCVRA